MVAARVIVAGVAVPSAPPVAVGAGTTTVRVIAAGDAVAAPVTVGAGTTTVRAIAAGVAFDPP